MNKVFIKIWVSIHFHMKTIYYEFLSKRPINSAIGLITQFNV